MMMITYWVKWQNEPPAKWYVVNMEEFCHRLKEEFIRRPRMLEWIISE